MTLQNVATHLMVKANLRPVLIERGESLRVDNLPITGGKDEPYQIVDQSLQDVSPVRIWAPEGMSVSVRAEAGPWVDVRGLSGELSIHASAGDIIVQGHHHGPIYLTADAGNISVSICEIVGKSRIKTNPGRVHISIPSEPKIEFSAESNLGKISADSNLIEQLPSESTPQVSVQSNVGTISLEQLKTE